ncbi:MAG: tetratricopeptide repeat protein [Lachnospiraceae bacterium]|nr:tetratricopeptide repeat protein [Lachnospiraceae bacterium]
MHRRYAAVLTAVMLLMAASCGKKETALERGLSFVTLQEYDQALEILLEAEVSEGVSEELLRAKGLAYMGLGEYDQAVSAFTDALSLAGTSCGSLERDINFYLSTCYIKLSDNESAMERLDAVLSSEPSNVTAALERGKLKLSMKDVSGAMADFDMAAGTDKKNAGVYLDIYDIFMSRKMVKEGASYLNSAKAADPADLNDYDKARLCYYTGDLEGACNYLEYARSIDKADTDMIKLLGRCYRELSKYENATAIYLGFLEEKPDPGICNELGISYSETGSYSQALEAFRRGIKIPENNTCMQELKANEIVCLENLHEYKEAAELAKAYLETYGTDEEMEKEYAFLVTRCGVY